MSESPSPAAEQARLRRERRQAKLKSEGSSRLSKITSTQSNSRLYEDAAAAGETTTPSSTATASPAPAKASSIPTTTRVTRSSARASAAPTVEDHAEDPPEIDLSEHYYQPQPKFRPSPSSNAMTPPSPFGGMGMMGEGGPSQDELSALMGMYGGGTPGGAEGGNPNDPMAALMQQMMGLPGADGTLPPGLQQPGQGEDKWGVWWAVLHTVCSLFLVVVSLRNSGWGGGFDGSLEEREARGTLTADSSKFFYSFATMELVLQSARFFLEKGRPPPGSMLSMVGQFLPHPFGMYLITAARYSVIWTTVVNDALLIIFVLAGVAWWNSL
ncbi:hypothetical protein DFH27DRAFT_602910 [Peziza echinospora]|nr:hypothetical protein DFH27DRAFT_602910 [Peziza echinospora]